MTYPEFMTLASERFSCRAYDSGRLPSRDHIEAVIDAARLAPSACNRQPWKFMVVTSRQGLEKIAAAYNREWIRTAPAAIIALGDHTAAWHRQADGKDHVDVDLAIAIEHICLAATALGMATCWVCNFDPAVLRREFGLAEGMEPIAILPIGYPAKGTQVPGKVRKDASEIIIWETDGKS